LKIGETAKLNATVLPEGREAAVNFVSSAETVATVDQNGNVTAVAVGKPQGHRLYHRLHSVDRGFATEPHETQTI
ncbi:MAG: Ig-like domain-containing protein, partial [Bacteroidaceae bacterium]|nr:Ig-like domain-containing protein [Bacteroidaceae bacterium]